MWIWTNQWLKFAKLEAPSWKPLRRLQLSNVTESQTRGASCVVLASNPTSFLPSSLVQASTHHLRIFPTTFGSQPGSVFTFLPSLSLTRSGSEAGDSSARRLLWSSGNSLSHCIVPISNCNPMIMILMMLMLKMILMLMKTIMMMISFHLWSEPSSFFRGLVL